MYRKHLRTLCIVLAAIVVLTLAFTGCKRKEGKTLDDVKATLQEEVEKLRSKVSQLEADLAEAKTDLETAVAEKSAALEEKVAAIKERDELRSDYKLYKNIISQDEVEQTLFGQPISTERDGEYRLAVKTATDGDFHAELSIYQAKDGKYEKIFSCPALVGKNGPGKQSEGDVKTPLGTWTIGEAYGIKDDPGSLVPFTKITDDMYWCATGSNGLNYNHLLYKSEHPDWDYSEDEHLMDYPIRYAYLLDLGYNAPCAPYAGNAIFLHCWKEPDYPTGGCVAVSEEDMIKILQTVTPGTSVTIY